MWFIFAFITFLAWGAADLFYKKSAAGAERYSHLKTSIIVGLVMGATAIVTLLVRGIAYDPRNLLIYLPVSAMYILSMTVGYFGLRYLELSVSSPVQNASGAVSCLLLILVLGEWPDGLSAVAIVLITLGVVGLGVLERREEMRRLADGGASRPLGFAAFVIPIFYCIIDALGTFFDGYYLDDVATTPLVGVTADTLEDVANISYELTFLLVAAVLFVYVRVIRREPILPRRQGNRLLAAAFEVGGQYAYVYAMAGNGVVAAPMIASYCVASVVLARVFLKEKLTAWQYTAVGAVMAGILLLGVAEGLAA